MTAVIMLMTASTAGFHVGEQVIGGRICTTTTTCETPKPAQPARKAPKRARYIAWADTGCDRTELSHTAQRLQTATVPQTHITPQPKRIGALWLFHLQ